MAPPPNNDFANAQIIATSSGTVSGTTRDATTEAAEPSGLGAQSVWYEFNCPEDGWYKFSILMAGHVYNGTFGFDNSYCVMSILPDGTLTQMTTTNCLTDSRGQLRNDDPNSGRDCVVAAPMLAGTTYYIKVAVGSGTNTQTFDFDLLWEKFTRPANDDFSSAQVVTSVPTTLVNQTNFNATFETGSESLDNTIPSTWDKEQSIWYKFTPPATGKYRIAITKASTSENNHDKQPGFITIQVSSGTTIGTFQAGEIYTDGVGPSGTFLEAACYVDLVGSTDYYVRVHCPYRNKGAEEVNFNSKTLEFDIEFAAVSLPANDNYANREALSTTLPNTLTASTKDATEEASEVSFPYTREQSIWYKFTPTSTGLYRFRIKRSSLVYEGGTSIDAGELAMSICPAAGLTNHISANAIPDNWYALTMIDQFWQNPTNASRLVSLTASTEYVIKITSNGGNSFDTFNDEVVEFELEWELITVPTNDNFANAITLSGASGTQDFDTLGSTVEANEPDNFYWNYTAGPGPQARGTVWFNWTAPSSGWFKFTVESLELSAASHDIAIYTGSALNALTRLNSAWAGSKPVAISPRKSTTTIGINAVSGTTYRIQVTGWGNEDGETARISWATLTTPVGDSAASAVVGRYQGLIDNYGHTDNDLPPNGVTLLSGHDEWWYNDGKIGKTKWMKYTAPEDLRIQITMRQWANNPPFTGTMTPGDAGLIAYKGADFASLVVAQALNVQANPDVMENVAMLMSPSVFYQSVTYEDYAVTAHPTSPNPIPVIDVAAGETLWICLFGLYDDDIEGDASVPAEPYHAMEFNADLVFDVLPPVNDAPANITSGSIYGSPTYAYNLTKSHWGNYLPYSDHLAGQFEGTTYGATAQAGEPAHAGYGPTRSVWFYGGVSTPGNWKFWVESAVDCVLSIYADDTTPDVTALTLIGEDDDSGAGNWPEVIFNTTVGKSIWVCVDSKTEGNFTLKWEWVNPGPAPANDNFANAVVVPMGGISVGTTIGAGGEYFEWDSEGLGSGVTDTVWFKFTATQTKRIKIEGRILSNNNDGYVWFDAYTGPDKDNLTRVGDPDYGGGLFRGPPFPTGSNDPLMIDVVNGTDYYIRVYTESGGSEECEIWIDTDSIFLDLQPGGTEWSNLEQATIPLKLTPGGSEFLDPPTVDAATVTLRFTVSGFDDIPNNDAGTIFLDLQPSGTDVEGFAPVDAATIYLDLQPISTLEMQIHECFAGEGNPDVRWYGDPRTRWATDPLTPEVRFWSRLHKGAQYC